MKSRLSKWIIALLLILVVGYGFFSLTRSLPDIQPTAMPLSVKTTANLSWPAQGESAVGIVGSSVLDINGAQTPRPTASTAKLITALMVLKAKPLGLGEPGPTITLTQADVNIYNAYLGEDGSVVPVIAGEQISEYQMLQAMLLPSANNMADSLAIWAYGSLPAYSTAANTYVKSLGLSGTTIGADASGFLPSTESTAQDLVKIGELTMMNPVLAGIVGQSSADGIPVAGTVNNVNSLLGTDNIVGVKTGNTDQAGGVFVGSVKFSLNDNSKVIVTANAGANTLSDALSGSLPLLQSVQTNYHNTVITSSGTAVAGYKAPWSSVTVHAAVNKDVLANVWGGNSFRLHFKGLKSVSYNAKVGAEAGDVSDPSLNSSSAEAALSQNIPGPSIFWRLLHP